MNPDTLHQPRPRAWLGFAALALLAPLASAQTAPTVAAETSIPAKPLELAEVRVLGSRIRQTEIEGPSPVNTYDQDYVRSTGALNLADFLNYLPQNYAGISAGRGSAPNELNPEFGQRTESTFPSFNFVLGSSAAPPAQSGVSGVSLRGLGSGSTLVLVDGRRVVQSAAGNRGTDSRQGFVDLNTIPLGMVERVEVITDGASAIYGGDAVAGVINVVLKKNWSGNELTGSYKGAFHGGGHERQITLTSGFITGKLSGTVSLDYYDRARLRASQREFSKNQDHRTIVASHNASGAPIFGRDLRLNWGYPAMVQARLGVLNGITEAGGNQTRFAIVKDGATGAATLATFTAVGPGPTNGASGVRRGNTSEFLDIIPESERYGASGNFTYRFSDRTEAFATYSFTETKGLYRTQPPVSSASASSGFGNFATIVPAAFNPFGQDVLVGMVHYEFGSVSQRTNTQAHSGAIGLRGQVGQTWQWEAVLGSQQQDFSEITRDFNGSAITAALNNPDASLRLNPFIDARTAGANQAAIYENMALYPTRTGTSRQHSFDVTADGTLRQIWGGPLQMAAGFSMLEIESDSTAVSYSSGFGGLITNTTVGGGERDSYAMFAELSVPLIGRENARAGARRLDLQLAARHERYDLAGDVTLPKYGVSWAPVRSVLVRAGYSEGFRPPALTEYQVAPSTFNASITDPRRTPASTTGVVVSRGSRPAIEPETSQTEFAGLIIEPPFATGLKLQVNYYDTKQQDVVQVLSAQTIVNNETLFADRITRAAPTAGDTALGQPGRITAIDQTFINFGAVRNRSVDFGIDYDLPWQDLGRWRIGLNATRTLESSRQLAPGQPALVDDGDTFAPPEWKFTGSLFWRQGSWNGSVFVSYLDGFTSNQAGNSLTFTYPVPSIYKVDVRGGYEFKEGVWRGYGKGLRLQAGIGNLFDEEPPFSDTVFGYNGGLHGAYALGRSYELSFTLPF